MKNPTSRRSFMKLLAAACVWRGAGVKSFGQATPPANSSNVAPGPFEPNWDSLKQYKAPDWFRDAKFGIWAHWTAQCVPEQGDWYARNMYMEGSADYKYQGAHHG